MRFCPYHKIEHDDAAFSGKNRYCRAGLNEYRRKSRVKRAEKRAAFLAEGAPACPVCNKEPILRKNAHRCRTCIDSRRFLCPCGRVTSNPTCGKCRHKKAKAARAEKRAAVLSRGVNVVTGTGECAQCGARLHRDPAGNIDVRHDCG